MKQKKNTGERLRGLMALVSDHHRGNGPCPNAEKLARLVDNRVSQEERQELMDHLSSCDACYQTWLLASSAHQGSGKRAGNTRRVKYALGYAGTAFAAVVSVVLYLNIQTFNGPQPMSSPPPPPTVDESVEAGFAPPLEKAKKQETSRQVFSAEAEADNMQFDAAPPQAPPSPQRSYLKSSPSVVAKREQSRMSTPDPLISYYQSLHGACSAAILEEQPWEALHKRGVLYLKQTSGANRHGKTEQIVQILKEMVDSGDFASGCQRIRHLLLQEKGEKNNLTP
nr:zf-HC2 domain-containing protein [uncultured Desulfobulbus sp.]